MHIMTLHLRPYAGVACAFMLISSLFMPQNALAAGDARFELRPHCIGGNESENVFGGPMPDLEQVVTPGDGRCPSFGVRDPENLQTNQLKAGEELDMDLIIKNPSKHDISRFRAWIAYDTSALEGMEVTISPAYPVPTPGENAFAPDEGYIKLSGESNQSNNGEVIVVARIRMRVTDTRFEGTPLTYFDLSGTAESRTGIFQKDGTSETNVLVANPGYLYVRFENDGSNSQTSIGTQSDTSAASSASPDSSSTTNGSTDSSSASSIATVVPSTVFTMLQVQGLRVTTEGSSVFLAWDALPSTELAGYNVYYGTTTGKYIQRRGVEKNATTLTLRALPVGTTYYFAVRGVNERGQEAEFSQEVGISVGNPATSTSPLTANSLPGSTPNTNGNVAGETGVSSILLAFLTLSAVTGTVLAFRRQWSAHI